MDKFKNSKLFFWTVEILLTATIIFVCTKISFIFSPIGIFISTIFVPLLLAGFLFYMLNPVVNLLMKIKISKTKKINRTWAVIIVFLILILAIVLLVASLIPHLIEQITNMVTAAPEFAKQMENALTHMTQHGFLKKFDWPSIIHKAETSYSKYLKNILGGLTSSLGAIVSLGVNVVVTAITVPVILFYMLKDGDRLLPAIGRLTPFLSEKHKKASAILLKKMNSTLSHYIGGQMIECLFVGTFITLGYMLIGEKYALVLGVFAALCNLIPYVGPFIGIIPALIVALSNNLLEVILVIIVVIIVQQLDGNVVYPLVIGKSLNIYPLTIIILLLAAGNIAGLFGMLLCIPVYAIAKIIVEFCYNLWRVDHDEDPLPAYSDLPDANLKPRPKKKTTKKDQD